MTTFTIDTDNHITAHATPEDAATTTTPLTASAAHRSSLNWPSLGRPSGCWIWSSLPGVQPIRKFTRTPPRLAECAPN